MSTSLAECYPVECFGCGAPGTSGNTDLYDGERYCADCLREVENAAAECEQSDRDSYNYGRGV